MTQDSDHTIAAEGTIPHCGNPAAHVAFKVVPRELVCTPQPCCVKTVARVERQLLRDCLQIVSNIVSDDEARRYWLTPGRYPAACCAEHAEAPEGCPERFLDILAPQPAIAALPPIVSSDETGDYYNAVVILDAATGTAAPVVVQRDNLMSMYECAMCGKDVTHGGRRRRAIMTCNHCGLRSYCSALCRETDVEHRTLSCTGAPDKKKARIVRRDFVDVDDHWLTTLHRYRQQAGLDETRRAQPTTTWAAAYYMMLEYDQSDTNRTEHENVAQADFNRHRFALPDAPAWPSFDDLAAAAEPFVEIIQLAIVAS